MTPYRGCVSSHVGCKPAELRASAIRPCDLGGHRTLLGNGPQQSHQRTGNRHHDWVGMFASGDQASRALAPPHVGLPTAVLDGCGVVFPSQLEMPTALGGVAGGPGAFDQSPTGRGIAGFGARTLPASRATRIFGGAQAEEFHELSGVIDTGEGTSCRHHGDRHRALDTRQGLERVDWQGGGATH